MNDEVNVDTTEEVVEAPATEEEVEPTTEGTEEVVATEEVVDEEATE